MLVITGLRKSELFEIKLNDINFEKRTLLVKVKKSRDKEKFREIRLPSDAFLTPMLLKLKTHLYDASAKQWYKRNLDLKDQWLFMNRSDKRISGCRTCWENHMRKLNLKFSPHWMRHFFVTMLRGNLSQDIIRDYIAHESIKTTGIYDHTNVNNISLVSEEIINKTFGNLLNPAQATAYEQI